MTGLDNWTGPSPTLVAEDVERLLRAMDARPPRTYGYDRGTRGIADGFGIAIRTVYRYWPGRVEWVEVDGYRIPFLCRAGCRPVLLDSRDKRGRLAEKLP